MLPTIWVRRLRLVTGFVLMAFVTSHLGLLAMGLASLHQIDAWYPYMMEPWEGRVGETLLGFSALVHLVLGLQSIAARRTLAMSRTDAVQLVLALLVPPLIIGHVLTLRITSELIAGFEPSYEFILSVYWSFAPLYAIQQLLALIVIWAHAAIGFYGFMVLRPIWKRIGGLVTPILFAVPILSLLGFAQGGKEVVDRLAVDPGFRQGIEGHWQRVNQVADRLMGIETVFLSIYFAIAGLAIGFFLLRYLIRRRATVHVSYDGGAVATGAKGLSILELSRTNDIPHASVCSGRGRCGTCRVEVIAGAERLSPAHAIETRTLAMVHSGPNVRLACQALVLGEGVSVARVLPPFADASAAREPEEWVTEPPASEPLPETAS